MYQTTQTITKKEALKLLNEAHGKLANALNFISWMHYYDNYFNENLAEEKRHLQGKPESCYHGLSAYDGAKLFSVTQIVKFMLGEKQPKLKWFLSHRKSIFTACALVLNYRKEIKKALKKLPLENIKNIDYVFMVSEDFKNEK